MSNGDPQNSGEIDTGTAYGLKPSTYDRRLVEVGPGTPMGELMRRYWQPVFLSRELTSDRPKRVRVLGEDLVIFRDKSGTPGLVHEQCAHRNASMYYGRIEEDGIRCAYHGWKWDAKGHCLDQPCEVNRGGENCKKVRQPWYPVQERYGLVYAYMGPPEKKPVLPRYAHLEDLGADERIEARSDPGVGPRVPLGDNVGQDFNWLQMFENTMDSPHLPWLHYHHSGDQFATIKVTEEVTVLPPYAEYQDLSGIILANSTPTGVTQGYPMQIPNGPKLLQLNEALVPNVATIGDFISILYCVPADDRNLITFMLYRTKGPQTRLEENPYHGGMLWHEMTEEQHQQYPGDYEMQRSIGQLPSHNREHMSPGDKAVVLLRRALLKAVKDVEEGRDPPGVSFDPAAPPVQGLGHGMRPYSG